MKRNFVQNFVDRIVTVSKDDTITSFVELL